MAEIPTKNIGQEIQEDSKQIAKNNDNSEQINTEIYNSAENYLKAIKSIISGQENINNIENHQQVLTQYKAAARSRLFKKGNVKRIYQYTIQFQKNINKALEQEIKTIFVFENPKTKQIKFFVFQPKEGIFEEQDQNWSPSINQSGTLIYNLYGTSDKLGKLGRVFTAGQITTLEEMLSSNSSSEKISDQMLKHQKELTNQFIEQYSKAKMGAVKLNQGDDKNIAPILQQYNFKYFSALSSLFYSQGKLRTYISNKMFDELEEQLNKMNIQIEYTGDKTKFYYLPKILITLPGRKAKSAEDYMQGMKETLALQMHLDWKENNKLYSYDMAYHGRGGYLKEAFFGAYFNLSPSEGVAPTHSFVSHLALRDTESGIFTGDYSYSYKNKNSQKNYEIQIKSESAGLNINQFIALASDILTHGKDNLLSFLRKKKSEYHAKRGYFKEFLSQGLEDIVGDALDEKLKEFLQST